MGHNEARRRQMQYVGKLMRGIDPAPIEAAIAAFDGISAVEIARHHRLERLRTRLLDDEAVLTEIIAAHPGADAQHLRQLRRNAIKEHLENRPPKSFRALFQELKALDATTEEESQ
jgi:ribosome-associated protein